MGFITYQCFVFRLRREEFINYLKANRFNVFTINDASGILRKSPKYASERLSTMRDVLRIERGIYCLEGTSIYAVASAIISPSYVSLISAYAFHELTTQLPSEIQVISSRQHSSLHFDGFRIRFIRLPRQRMFGFSRLDGGMIADPEKAIVDSIYLNIFVEETKEVLQENHEQLESAKIIEYAHLMKSRATLNKIGFLLEKCGYNTESISPIRSGRFVKLGDNPGQRDNKWKVIYAD